MARAGRRPGQSDTREQILDAARRRFGEQGYDGATVRAIATDAGVNAALLHHFFGNKEQLFLAAMRLPINPAELISQVLAGPRDTAGERLVRTFLGFWSAPERRDPFLALLRSAMTNEQAATMVRQFMSRQVLAPIAEHLGLPPVRVGCMAGQLIGVVLLRYVVAVPPMAEATDDEIATLVSPVLQYYLDD